MIHRSTTLRLALLAVFLALPACATTGTGEITTADVELVAWGGTVAALEASDATLDEAETIADIADVAYRVVTGGKDDPEALSEGWYAELLVAFGIDSPLVRYGVSVLAQVLERSPMVGDRVSIPHVAAGFAGVQRGAGDYAAVQERTTRSRSADGHWDWPPLRRLE